MVSTLADKYPYLCQEGQYDLTEGIVQCSRDEFVELEHKRTKSTRTFLNKELAGVNKRNGIVLFHKKGFIFKWKELKFGGVNWGKYYSMFHVDSDQHIPTIGGNHSYGNRDDDYGGMTFAIHPNIYRKYTDLNLPAAKKARNHIIRMCIGYAQERSLENAHKIGAYNEFVQVMRNMFNNNDQHDGLWDGFAVARAAKPKECCVCGDKAVVNVQKMRCKHCIAYV